MAILIQVSPGAIQIQLLSGLFKNKEIDPQVLPGAIYIQSLQGCLKTGSDFVDDSWKKSKNHPFVVQFQVGNEE